MQLGRLTRVFLVVLPLLLNAACTSLPVAVEREVSRAFTASHETTLGRMFAADVAEHPGESGIDLLDTGREALQVRLAALAMAEQAVDLQYYIWNSDYAGRLMAERVLQAADRGVRVRMLLEDFTVGDRDVPLLTMDAHPNIEVRVYNPNANRKGLAKWLAFIGEFGRLNQRMHNKSFVVDGSAAIVGGRNIGDEYFDLHDELNFRDRDLLAVGPVVREVARGFDAYWNSERSYRVRSIAKEKVSPGDVPAMRARLLDAIRDHTGAEYALPLDVAAGRSLLETWRSKLVWAEASVISDRAPKLDEIDGDKPKQVAQTLGGMVRSAQREVLIESAYFIVGDDGLKSTKALTEQGIAIRALTNSLASNDVTPNHAGYARRRQRMLRSGIELYELRPDAASCRRLLEITGRCGDDSIFGLHSKSVVFDRNKVFVGSFNLNLRSVYLNSEIGLIVRSPALATRVATDIEENMRPENSWRVILDENGRPSWVGTKDGAEVRYSSEPETGAWRRFVSGFLSLLPIEKYL